MEMAIAILKAGRSYDEASKSSGISVTKIIENWKTIQNMRTLL